MIVCYQSSQSGFSCKGQVIHEMCWGHFKFRKDFWLTSRSCHFFSVETSCFTGWWLVMGQLRATCPRIRSQPNHTHTHTHTLTCLLLNSPLDLVQVEMKLWTQGFLSPELPWSLVYKLAYANLLHQLLPYSSLSSAYCTFVGIISTRITNTYCCNLML